MAVLIIFLAAGCGPSAVAPSGSGVAPTGAPSPSAITAVTAKPGQATKAAFGWQRIAVEKATDVMGDWRALAGSPFGYAALASSPAAVWFSPDGLSWSETRLAVPEGTALLAEVVTGGEDGLLVGGKYTPCSERAYARNPFGDCRSRPVSWLSSDGQSWMASAAWNGPLGEPGRAGSLFNQLWAVPGGWEAAQAFDPSDESDDFDLEGLAIWYSSDGLVWELRKPQRSDDGECATYLPAELRAGADAAGRRVAAAADLGSFCAAPRVWTSADGRAWTPVLAFGAEWPQAAIRVVLPGTSDRPWRLLGSEDADNYAPGAVAWRSTDLVTWSKDLLPVGVTPGAVLAGAQGRGLDVAVGQGEGASFTWTSDDGVDWRLADGPSPPIEAVASGPVGVLGLIGTWDDAGDTVTGFEVWQLMSG